MKFCPSNFFPICGMVCFSWVLLTSCGLLRGCPSSSPRFGGGGGGPLPPVPGFPGFPGSPGFLGFPGFPEFPGSGDPDLDGVFIGFPPFPFTSVSVGWVVVPLMAGPSLGILRKWSMFFSLGQGVFGGVLPVGNLSGSLWALGVYGGGFPLIYSHKQISKSFGHWQRFIFTVRRVKDCLCNRRSLAASCGIDWLVVVSECITDSLAG